MLLIHFQIISLAPDDWKFLLLKAYDPVANISFINKFDFSRVSASTYKLIEKKIIYFEIPLSLYLTTCEKISW